MLRRARSKAAASGEEGARVPCERARPRPKKRMWPVGFISISKKKKSVSVAPHSVADAESSGGGSRLQHKQLAPLLYYRYNVNITDDSMGRAWQQRAHADRGFSARYPARRMDSWIHYPWRRRDGRRSCYPRSIRSPSFLPAQKQELMKGIRCSSAPFPSVLPHPKRKKKKRSTLAGQG